MSFILLAVCLHYVTSLVWLILKMPFPGYKIKDTPKEYLPFIKGNAFTILSIANVIL
jgi:hypothetical protein